MAEKLRLQEHRDTSGSIWEFVHPRCARKRRDDVEEVEAMVAAGETEIARDELVWLLSECPDFLEAHLHLGLIALEEDDPKLARGHFGRAYELGLRALEAAGNPRPLPYDRNGNKPFFEAAKGLVHCLVATGKRGLAKDVVTRANALDPSDPLALAALLAAPRTPPRKKPS
jgi:tetratricopeptide (TPR) repeat protein